MVDRVHVKAPAKVNLVLKVLEQQDNGYHEIWSIMQTVDLCDCLSIRRVSTSRDIHLECQPDHVPSGKDNLVYRAAELVLAKAGLPDGLEIRLTKSIPMAAGLGGGSSDAAATIFGLVRLFGLEWSPDEMATLGARLGSDVPFFLYGAQALIQGIGEKVIPLEITGARWIVLVNPGFPIETRWAYHELAKARDVVPTLSKSLASIETAKGLPFPNLVPLMENDFEPAIFQKYSCLHELKSQFLSQGAEAALLSGSGATVFGIFSDQELAEEVMRSMDQDPQTRVFCVPVRSQGLALVDD